MVAGRGALRSPLPLSSLLVEFAELLPELHCVNHDDILAIHDRTDFQRDLVPVVAEVEDDAFAGDIVERQATMLDDVGTPLLTDAVTAGGRSEPNGHAMRAYIMSDTTGAEGHLPNASPSACGPVSAATASPGQIRDQPGAGPGGS